MENSVRGAMRSIAIHASLVLGVMAWAAAPPVGALELGRMAPADLARLEARTVCSCVFVQRMSLAQCSDGKSAIWRYPSADAAPALLGGPRERIELTRERTSGAVRLFAADELLAQSRYLADGGGCVTSPVGDKASATNLSALPGAAVPGAPGGDPAAVDSGAVSAALPRGALPAGVDSARIHAALDEGFAESGPLRGLARAAVVVAGGRVVVDRYAPQYGPHNLYYVGSIAKTFGNLLAGLLAAEGKLDVKERASLPEWREVTDARKRITYDQLLKMTSGIAWDEEFWAPGEPGYEVYFGGSAGLDVRRYMVGRPLEAAPGSHFEYSTGAASLLATALQDKLGEPRREALLKYFQARLHEPLGMRQVVTEFDPNGVFLSGHGVFIGAEDLARIGTLLLDDGQWQGKRILPQGWVAYSTQPALKDAGYGAQLALGVAGMPECFGHTGVGQNVLAVCPSRGVVVVWLSSAFDFTGAVEFAAGERLVRQIASGFPKREE
jgi:CubicO group peptidase (beta-lactamase class C family)